MGIPSGLPAPQRFSVQAGEGRPEPRHSIPVTKSEVGAVSDDVHPEDVFALHFGQGLSRQRCLNGQVSPPNPDFFPGTGFGEGHSLLGTVNSRSPANGELPGHLRHPNMST